MEQASEREAGQGGTRSLLHHGHHLFSSVSPLVLPFIYLATPVPFRDTAASETQQPQRHSILRDTAVSETQQPQRHSSSKSSTLFSNLARSRTPGNKGRGLSISSLLTIALLKFQLWNLFCATAWSRNVGAVPKFARR